MPDMLVTTENQAKPELCWTRREILQQPDTLRATQSVVREQAGRIEAFLKPLLEDPALRIVLTGAGSSSFIGECLAPCLSALLHRSVESVPTTDLVSAPHLFLRAEQSMLLVSFGRSGNSPESMAAIELAQALVPQVRHLIVTCNKDGALAHLVLPGAFVVTLPDATHDRGFAMTSSFTAMTYAALAIFVGAANMQHRSEAIARSIADTLAHVEPRMKVLAGAGFNRVVYLGSGSLKGLAREASLKLLELTDGEIVSFADTPMGFRHGPKTVLNQQTLVIVFVSNHELTRRYDMDLVEELQRDGACGAVVVVSAQGEPKAAINIPHMNDAADIDLLFPYVVPAQMLGLYAALHYKLDPDRPNASGTVNRVVQGVRIHASGA
jgi:tagatose-6-phosphate ketose/aldose isomerase